MEMYIRGVVSTLMANNQEAFELSDDDKMWSYTMNLIQPKGIRKDFIWRIREVTRG